MKRGHYVNMLVFRGSINAESNTTKSRPPACLLLLFLEPMGRFRLQTLWLSILPLLLEKSATLVYAQPTLLPFTDCTSSATRTSPNYDPNERINVSSVFGQIAYPDGQKTLRLNVLADTGESVIPSETDTNGNLILCESNS